MRLCNFQLTHLWEGDCNYKVEVKQIDGKIFQPTHLWEGDCNVQGADWGSMKFYLSTHPSLGRRLQPIFGGFLPSIGGRFSNYHSGSHHLRQKIEAMMHPYFHEVKALLPAAKDTSALLLEEGNLLIQPHPHTNLISKFVPGWQSTSG